MDSAAQTDTFARIYTAHWDPLMRLALVTTNSVDAAEDIVQDAFVDLYRGLHEVIDPPRWLYRAVANRSISWLRRLLTARRLTYRASPPLAIPEPDPGDPVVRKALLQLRPRQRAALFLRYYVDMSEVDIAEALGCKQGTVKSLLHRGLAVLRENLDEH